MEITRAQEKWGAMVALLSMDVVKPFYGYMGLDIEDPDRFMLLLRQVIIANRREFEANPGRVPELRKRTLTAISRTLGPAKAEELEYWFDDSFVWFPDEDAVYDQWGAILMQSVSKEDRWSFLGLPDRLSETARKKLLDEVMENANKEIYALSDKVDEIPHTKWDIEMYALHHFDDYDYDPFSIGVMAVVRYRREKRYVKWLVESMDKEELDTFINNANRLRRDKPQMQILKEIRVPEELQSC